jgi:hypothetical protein
MNSEKIIFLAILTLIIIIPTANAQVSIAEKAEQKTVGITINSIGEVHVKQMVKSSNVSTQIELVNGTISNLKITNEVSEEKQHGMIGENSILILPSNEDTIIEYDLKDALFFKDNMWTWSFRYLEDTSFILPKEVDLIFVNGKPVYLDKMKGILCHGCQMILEYSIGEPRIIKNVKWEDKEFTVEIRSLAEINQFSFDQSAKNISFEVNGKNQFVTVIIPPELLWGPYDVFLGDAKIHSFEYINNGTHVWVSMKPDDSGSVSIIGTTVVPEFPLIAPLAVGFLMIVILPIIRKVNLR